MIFDPAGGKWKDGSTGSKTLTVESGQPVTAPEEPAKDDYDFTGWYDGDKPADLSEITSNLTVTAHWEEKEKPAPISIEDAKVVLKKSSFVYNTKVQKPSKITVKTKDGNVLKKGTDYTVKWPNTPKNVGGHTVTITGIGKYTGTVKAKYKIRPLGTSIKKINYVGGIKYHVEWKKKSTLMSTSRITGYQIQIANNSRSNKILKTVKVKGYKKVSTTIRMDKRLSFGYARIRTFKTIKGKDYYSNWSEIKKIK